MRYRQVLPHRDLAPYIDAYWTITGKSTIAAAEKIMPDGCIDIILNLGEDFKTDNGSFLMKNQQAYLVGTMTRYKEIIRSGDTNLIGIRFKPGAFLFFYNHSFLHQIVDKTVEFEKKAAPEINEDSRDLASCLNRFFLDKLSPSYPIQLLNAVVADINKLKGLVTVEALAKKHFISLRQLERNFKLYIGISPKEYINFVRYQFVLEKIRNNHPKKSLQDIACDSGYYDHAHLSNEIRKHTGSTPSEM
ncbi:DUF6597 domain-containing transcriptional factor [Flavitalea flava]